MNFRDYLQSKIVLIAFEFILVILLSLFIILLKFPLHMMITFIIFSFFFIILYFISNFFYEKNRLKKLQNKINSLSEKYLLGEILTKPLSAVEKAYFQIMKEISRSAIGYVERAKQDKEDYCDYVENWIHEIKTPLTACSLILSNQTNNLKLRNELKKVENLLESILYYARLKSVTHDLSFHNFFVKEIVEEVIKNQKELLISANISIDIKGDFEILSDKKILYFIITQLITNCVKYAKGKSISIELESPIIMVKDTGIGILAHEIFKVTDKGFTGTNGRKISSSTGMGLYIVKGLCDLIGIHFKIESEINQYTKVSLTFSNLTKM